MAGLDWLGHRSLLAPSYQTRAHGKRHEAAEKRASGEQPQFLYNTNRGHNSVAMFEIDPDTGKLGVIGWQSTGGEWPRGMNIDPSGTLLYAANQNTDTVAVFRIQLSNGRLNSSTLVSIPTPVDVEFGPLA